MRDRNTTNTRLRTLPAAAACLLACCGLHAEEAPVLPPVADWHGTSERLLENTPPAWRTPAEASDFRTTPDYATTLEFLRRLDRASSLVSMREIGRSAGGRPLMLVIATRDPRHDFDSLRRSPRARVLAQAGIHAGEVDGKDAVLLLLRDIVTGRRSDVLDRATLLFVPVFNPDGHERVSHSGRVNQRGPENAGWRTNGRNLNLNRDYAKLAAPETRALVDLLAAVDPDLYLDLHVTDGMDHQYDVTYGSNVHEPWSPAIAAWLGGEYRRTVDAGLTEAGHAPGQFYLERNPRDPAAGMVHPRMTARLSNGYGDLRHVPSVLLEMHSLKPYKRRVLGTYAFVEQSLLAAGRDVEVLRRAIREDRARRAESLPVAFALQAQPARELEFLGIAHETFDSPITGIREVRWLGTPVTQRVPVFSFESTVTVRRPAAYWIPPAWADVAARLREHGIRVEKTTSAVTRPLRFYRLQTPKLDTAPSEGRVPVTVEGVELLTREVEWPAGSFRVSSDQPLGDLAMVLLEPQSVDSYFAWGYLHEILQRTEYAENYVMEPLAHRMLDLDPALRAAWKEALRDPAFAANPEQRLEWFYRRSGLADPQHLLYPVAREE